MKYMNALNNVVTLTENKAVNKFGDVLLWVRCENNKIISIWEKDFLRDFKELN